VLFLFHPFRTLKITAQVCSDISQTTVLLLAD